MGIIFKERGILDTFSNRNIVYKLEATDSGVVGVFLNIYFDFGRNGLIQFKRTLMPKGSMGATYKEAQQFLNKVREFRDVLENLNAWLVSNHTENFLKYVIDVYPITVFGSKKNNDIQVVFMGLETNHMMIKFTRGKTKEQDLVMNQKVDSFIAVLNKFIYRCENELLTPLSA